MIYQSPSSSYPILLRTCKSNSISISCSKSVTGQLVQLVVADITGDMILVVLSSGASKYEVFS